jgi:hypothetical protein
MKIRRVRAKLLHAVGRADGQTDMIKLIVAFVVLRTLLTTSKWCAEYQLVAVWVYTRVELSTIKYCAIRMFKCL